MKVFKVWQEVMAREKKPRKIANEVAAILMDRYGIGLGDSDIRKRVSDMKKLLHAA